MIIVDKLKNIVKNQKKMLLFLLIIMLLGIVFGSVLNVLLNANDKNLVKEYIENFFLNIQNGNIDYQKTLINTIISNLSYVLFTWLLGISIIGLPISIFLYFINSIILGFSITSIIALYNAKGILYAFSYVFPHQFIAIIINTFLMVYVITISLYLIKAVFNKQSINFKNIINKYLIVLGVAIISVLINSLIEVFVMPNFIKLFI